jgi:hypothetical protein
MEQTFGLDFRTLPYDYDINSPLEIELLKKLHILLNPLCIDENYITNKIREDFPNFIYETSCFKLLDESNDIFDCIFNYISDNIHIDLSDDEDIILYLASNGYTFMLKKFLVSIRMTRHSAYIKLDFENAIVEAIKNNHIEVVRLLYELKPSLIEHIELYIYDIEEDIIIRNVQFFIYLSQFSQDIEERLYDLNLQTNVLNYDEIINNLQHIPSNDIDIKDCPICYETKSDLITECNHQYCTSCIKEWWIHKREFIHKCPYCKTHIQPTNCKKIV